MLPYLIIELITWVDWSNASHHHHHNHRHPKHWWNEWAMGTMAKSMISSMIAITSKAKTNNQHKTERKKTRASVYRVNIQTKNINLLTLDINVKKSHKQFTAFIKINHFIVKLMNIDFGRGYNAFAWVVFDRIEQKMNTKNNELTNNIFLSCRILVLLWHH